MHYSYGIGKFMRSAVILIFPLPLEAKFRLYELRMVGLDIFTTEDLRNLFYWQQGLDPNDYMPEWAYD